ncbi:methylated-DNA--[protein]-cysteine S-methyltransferase [Brevibacterium litoralis]|uniref:methylated-DNA--[protein]-cysteine S-methyltransferase n=1 Tax=Brevibacterium litoralis TaxID=3138935 RepID=UPI0032F03D32
MNTEQRYTDPWSATDLAYAEELAYADEAARERAAVGAEVAEDTEITPVDDREFLGEIERSLLLGGSTVEHQILRKLNLRLVEQAGSEGLVDARYAFLQSPMGNLLVVATPFGLLRIGFDTEHFTTVLDEVAAVVGPAVVEDPVGIRHHLDELEQYFAGERRTFDLPLDMRLMKTGGFRSKVQLALPDIPYGETYSYTQMALHVDNPKATRAVGTACAQNPLPIVLPCHRVVRTDGSFGNYRGGHDRKQWILTFESTQLEKERSAAPF